VGEIRGCFGLLLAFVGWVLGVFSSRFARCFITVSIQLGNGSGYSINRKEASMSYHQLSQQMLLSALVIFSLAGCVAPIVTPATQAPATSVSNSTGTATPIATTAPQTQTATRTPLPSATPTPGTTPTPSPTFTKTPLVDPQNPFDALYATNFSLQALSADTIPLVSKPGVKATSLSNPSYIDPVYGTRIYRITAATDFPDATFVRHDYSRRQAFNADNSRFIATASNGNWLLYDANTFQMLPRTGGNGALRGPAGDCEMIWHPTDPKKLWYMSGNGLIWYEKDVETDQDTVLVDFTGRLPWSQATTVWTKSEGTSSADGRYWAFMATTYDSVNQTNTIYGLFTWDRQQDKIIGTYDAANFGGAFPDHISIAPSGKYAVPSWAYIPTLGTRAFPLDFSSSIQLHTQSEHSDLAIGPNGEDYYVLTDYDSGKIRAVDIATGASFDLMALYPASGESYAAHISGKAYDRPGWVLISTYADAADYGSTTPAPTLRPMYRKIMLVELKPGGRQLNVAHTRTADNYGGYWGEPQATINRDGSRIIFASNFNDGNPPDDYMIGLPSWIYGN
jgi:hypothetical protein